MVISQFYQLWRSFCNSFNKQQMSISFFKIAFQNVFLKLSNFFLPFIALIEVYNSYNSILVTFQFVNQFAFQNSNSQFCQSYLFSTTVCIPFLQVFIVFLLPYRENCYLVTNYFLRNFEKNM